MATLVTDCFNRADSTGLGANYGAGSGQTQLNLSAHTATGPSGYGQSYWSANSFSNDLFVAAKAVNAANASGRHCYVGGRTNNSTHGDGYWFEFNDSAWRLYYTDTGGTDHNFETGASGFLKTDIGEIRMSGTTINAWKNGVKISADYTDSNLTTGPPAIACTDNNTFMDDFMAGDLSGTMRPDSEGANTGVTASSTISWTHVVRSGTTLLEVKFGGYSDNAMSVTSVTFGSDNLVHLGGQGMGTTFADFQDVWYEVNPTVQSATITVTFGQTANSVSGASVSWMNTDNSTGVNNFTTNSNGGSASITTTITTTSGNTAVDWFQFSSATETASPDVGPSLVNNEIITDAKCGTSFLPATGASVTLTWTITTSRPWISCGYQILAAGQLGPPVSGWMYPIEQPMQRASEILGY